MLALSRSVLSKPVKTMVARSLAANQQPSWTVVREMNVLSKESAEEFKKQDYTIRQKETGRPISPHVTIYSFPVAAISSITNRFAGIALSLGCAGLGAAELFSGSGSALAMMQWIGGIDSLLLTSGAKFAVTFPVVYHYGGGIRHFMWDNKPENLSNDSVRKSSQVLMGVSVAVAGVSMFL